MYTYKCVLLMSYTFTYIHTYCKIKLNFIKLNLIELFNSNSNKIYSILFYFYITMQEGRKGNFFIYAIFIPQKRLYFTV